MTTVPVTVVIPIFNGSDLLPRAMASVRAQTTQPAEVLVVDDGSSDDSADLAERLGARVIRQPNAGSSAARNTGIQAASQPWIALLDHDDVWEPTKLARQFDAVAAFPEAVAVATDCVMAREDGCTIAPSYFHREVVHFDRLSVTRRSGSLTLHAAAAEEVGTMGWFLLPSTMLIRRDVLIRVGMFDRRVSYLEDACCFLRVLTTGPLALVNEPLARYVLHASNRSSDLLAMLRGKAALQALMAAEPHRYPVSYREHLTRGLPSTFLDMAGHEMEIGDSAGARRHAIQAFRLEPSVRAARLLAISLLPPFARHVLRQLVSARRAPSRATSAPAHEFPGSVTTE